jgi:hypothetical protein
MGQTAKEVAEHVAAIHNRQRLFLLGRTGVEKYYDTLDERYLGVGGVGAMKTGGYGSSSGSSYGSGSGMGSGSGSGADNYSGDLTAPVVFSLLFMASLYFISNFGIIETPYSDVTFYVTVLIAFLVAFVVAIMVYKKSMSQYGKSIVNFFLDVQSIIAGGLVVILIVGALYTVFFT